MKSKSLSLKRSTKLLVTFFTAILSSNIASAQSTNVVDLLKALDFTGSNSPVYQQMNGIINRTEATTYKDISKKAPAIFACTGANAMSENCQGGKGKNSQLLDAITVMKYTADLKMALDLNKDQYAKIKDFPTNLDEYTASIRAKWDGLTEKQKEDLGPPKEQDKYNSAISETKSSIGSAKELVKAETDLANYKIAQATLKLFESLDVADIPKELQDYNDPKKIAELEKKVSGEKKKFEESLQKIAELDANYRDEAFSGVQTALKDMKADPSSISYKDIWAQIDEFADCKDPKVLAKDAKKKAQCQKTAGRYLANLVGGGEKPTQYNTYSDQNCEFFDKNQELFKAIGGPGGFLSQLASMNYQKCEHELGAGDESCIKKGTRLARAVGDPYGQTQLYYEDPTKQVSISPQFIGGATDTQASLNLGASTQPSDPFALYTPNQTTPAFMPTGEGWNSNVGGTDFTLNANSASQLYNNFAGVVGGSGLGSSNFTNKYSPTLNQISSNNGVISSLITNVAITPKIYTDRAASVQNTLQLASGGGPRYDSSSSYDSTIDLRQKISALNAQKSKLIEDLVSNYQYLNESQYLAQAEYANRWLSTSQKRDFILNSTLAKGSIDYIKYQMRAIDSEIALYYSNTNAYLYSQGYPSEVFLDISLMFADSSKKLPAKRSLKLSNVKTPVKVRYQLKEGWQNEFKKYIADMQKKAEEAKKELNANKAKLKKLLAQKMPSVNTDELPTLARVDYERNNMYALRETAKKNMAIIDKAMTYHKNKRSVTPPSIYKQYEKESAELKRSMKKFVNAVDQADPKIVKAQTVISQLQLEIPRAEVLRAVAKNMVEKGL